MPLGSAKSFSSSMRPGCCIPEDSLPAHIHVVLSDFTDGNCLDCDEEMNTMFELGNLVIHNPALPLTFGLWDANWSVYILDLLNDCPRLVPPYGYYPPRDVFIWTTLWCWVYEGYYWYRLKVFVATFSTIGVWIKSWSYQLDFRQDGCNPMDRIVPFDSHENFISNTCNGGEISARVYWP